MKKNAEKDKLNKPVPPVKPGEKPPVKPTDVKPSEKAPVKPADAKPRPSQVQVPKDVKKDELKVDGNEWKGPDEKQRRASNRKSKTAEDYIALKL